MKVLFSMILKFCSFSVNCLNLNLNVGFKSVSFIEGNVNFNAVNYRKVLNMIVNPIFHSSLVQGSAKCKLIH